MIIVTSGSTSMICQRGLWHWLPNALPGIVSPPYSQQCGGVDREIDINMSNVPRALTLGWLFLISFASAGWSGESVEVDVCVYGATPGGITAAVAVRRGGRSVAIVEPSRWVGGMLGAGLKPTQDCPNIEATGGLTRELLETLGHPVELHDGRQIRRQLPVAELKPADIRRDFLALLEDHQVPIVYSHRISNCEKVGTAIRSATFDLAPFDARGCPPPEAERPAALRVTAKVFVDASYEGDLMARAGVSYRVGRESAEEFGEPNAGVQPPAEEAPIDPFVVPGDLSSGLLPWVIQDHGKPIGAADEFTQAYNFRFYVTDDPRFRIPLTPPDDYDAREFELVGRYVEHLSNTISDQPTLFDRLSRIFPGWLNAAEYNYHRDSLFSMSPVGISQQYVDGDYATKSRIWKQHQDYLCGLHQFLSTDQRVPMAFREQTAALGLDGRHHGETHGWPHQLYVRVSRRMMGRFIITAHDVYNRTSVEDPIGLAQYGIDTYPSRRIWFTRNGQVYVGLEGKMFIGGAQGPTNVPYPIPYRAITPRREECTNLLVPICFSATHLGYASARMEPVFMICGQSAGIAACQALSEGVAVQQIDMSAYHQSLLEAGQILEWKAEAGRPDSSQSGSGAYTFPSLCRI